MENERLYSLRNRWFALSVGAVVFVFLVSAAFGFIFLPSLQRNTSFASLWNAICSAAGQPQASPAVEIVEPAYHPDKRHCHAARRHAKRYNHRPWRHARAPLHHVPRRARASARRTPPTSPASIDQAIYKQLIDFQTGARSSAVMAPLVARPDRRRGARTCRLLRLSTASALDERRQAGTVHCCRGRTYARHCPVRRLSWRGRPQGRLSIAGWRTGRLSPCSVARVQERHAPQRYQRSDEQHRPRDDGSGNRRSCPLLRRLINHNCQAARAAGHRATYGIPRGRPDQAINAFFVPPYRTKSDCGPSMNPSTPLRATATAFC